MATQMFLIGSNISEYGDVSRCANDNNLAGAAFLWTSRKLATSRGSLLALSASKSTVNGPTNGLEIGGGSTNAYEWISEPVAADVTISGTVTINLWMAESNMSANVCAQIWVRVIRATDNSVVTILNSQNGTNELPVTTRAAQNWTATPTSTTLNRGDRISVVVAGNDAAANMGSGFTFNLGFNGNSAGADGDSYVTFNETITFETSSPAGSVLYLTDSAASGSINPGSATEKEAWTSRGAGVATAVTNTAAGWTTGIQTTGSAGGTAVEWYSRPLVAFTLGGLATMNVRAAESSGSANASLRCEVARVDSDGTNPTVWASWCLPNTSGEGEITTSEAAYLARVSGDDLAFTDGQRIRIRVYLEDIWSGPLVTGHTVTVYYAGTSGGASGDTYLTLPQSVTEYSLEYVPRSPGIDSGFGHF